MSVQLYHLTLKHPSLPFKCVVGQFSGEKKVQQLVLVSATVIETYLPNSESGKLEKLSSQPVFGIIQSADKIRLPLSQRDALVLTADSGNIIIAHFSSQSLKFVPVLQEPHSKNGLRRLTPGHHLCVNPQNRAIMIGALERSKFVYKVEANESSGGIALSSPLESSSKNTLTLELCLLDTNFDNPLWAAIEVDHSDYTTNTFDIEQSPFLLNYYELDQGLNYIVHKKSKSSLPSSATTLIPLPGHIGGVLVACSSYLIYESGPGSPRLYLPLPKRQGTNETTITTYCTHILKKNNFFILLQTALGDLLKLTAEVDPHSEKISKLSVSYFDSIPPCNGLHILKSGFMFANVSNDNKLFYQFESLGEENESVCHYQETVPGPEDSKHFQPQGLQNLALVDILDSLGPLIGCELVEKKDRKHPDPLKQLVTLSSRAHMKTLTFGLPVSELVTAPVPIVPTSIFTTSLSQASKNDDYLILTSSLLSKTLVLSIGEVVEEVNESGFVLDQHTVAVQQVGHNSVVQIHSNGIRHVRHELDDDQNVNSRKTTDWFPPAGITVHKASSNNEQVIIALSNREICYFEVDPSDDQLIEYQERYEVPTGSITALAISSAFLGDSERKSRFAVVGSSDESLQVISLEPRNCFEVLTLQALSANCSSLLLLPKDPDTDFVHIGMSNGVYARVFIDKISGKLRDTRLKYLGTVPVYLRKLALPNLKQPAILATSSRPWVGFHNNEGLFKLCPLINSDIIDGLSFYSEDIGSESVVGIFEDNLTIFQIGNDEGGDFNVNNDFASSRLRLRFLPKRMVKSPTDNKCFVIEAEFNTKSPYEDDKETDSDYYQAFGYPREENAWASCLQMIDLEANEVNQTISFEHQECPISMCLKDFGNEHYLIVGTTKNLTFLPHASGPSFLYTFRIKMQKQQAQSLEFVHKTVVDGEPTAMISFNEKLLVGAKNNLILYELGQKQLLRKSLTGRTFLRRVNQLLHPGGDVIIVGDASESTVYFKFDNSKNQFFPISNDSEKRQVTAMANLDSRTVVAGDKFGNIFVRRLPDEITDQIDNTVLLKAKESFLNGSCSRLQKLCDFYIQDIPTSFHKGSFVIGGTDSIIYTGIQGTVGILLPVTTKVEASFLGLLEMKLREYFDPESRELNVSRHGSNLLGKDHVKFRGYFNPIINVFDGDFIERFLEMPSSAKIRIASELDRSPRDIERKLYDLRNKTAF